MARKAAEHPVPEAAVPPTAVPNNEQAPDRPTDLSKRSWWGVLKRTAKEFNNDNLTDWAAALTYYAVLSIFPGILLALSLFNILLTETTKNEVIANITALAPKTVADPLTNAVDELSQGKGAAGVLAIVGLLGALWSASGYISAFMRAANAIYDVPEGRPIWKTLPIRIGVTILVGTLLGAAALSIVFTGRLAEQVGGYLGFGEGAVTVWGIAKWPALLVVVMIVLAVLYRAAPNARQGGFRWVSPGSILAVVLWLAASAGFAVYVANFGSYNKTYGTLGGVITFLIWLWISNIAVLLGAEFDSELERGRAIEGGHPPADEPFIALRDDRAVDPDADRGLGETAESR